MLRMLAVGISMIIIGFMIVVYDDLDKTERLQHAQQELFLLMRQ